MPISEKIILSHHLRKSRKIAKAVLKTLPLKSSVIISHRIELRDGISTVITEIEVTGTRFYKSGASKIINDETLLKELIETKKYD